MACSLAIGETARVAQVSSVTDARVRKALLHQSAPTRGPYPVDLVLQDTDAARSTKTVSLLGPWKGVIGVELRN